MLSAVGGITVVARRNVVGLGDLAQAQKAFYLGFFLCLLQAADGILTSVGISRFGIAMEGNPFLRHLMQELGHVQALGIVKFVAILVVINLAFFAKKLPWINNAMGAISAIYLFAAIVPWTYILFIKPYFA